MDDLIPLARLDVGQTARIGRIEGRPDHVHRLEEFGLRKGVRVQMFRPGNPCILRLAAGKVCLRSHDLVQIFVKPLDRSPQPVLSVSTAVVTEAARVPG